MKILTIDPGASGGLAWTDAEGIICAEKMPQGMTAQADRIRALAVEVPGLRAVIEKTGTARPSDAKTAAVKFARHCGNLEAILYTLGIPTKEVAPQVWQKSLGALPKDKRERKRAIRECMARRFPHLSVTLSTADALGILTWACEKQSSGLSSGGDRSEKARAYQERK
jgi:hypothetical protein